MKTTMCLLMLLALCGCATCDVRFGHEETVVYPATYADCQVVRYAVDEEAVPLLVFFAPLVVGDFALSLISDTVLLPYDMARLFAK